MNVHYSGEFTVQASERISSRYPIKWLIALGRNPLVVFLGMIVLEVILMDLIMVSGNGDGKISLWQWLFNGFATLFPSFQFAGTVFGLIHLVGWSVVAIVLHNKGIYISL
jgi:hypothetical protein